jgi:hypothetical protein
MLASLPVSPEGDQHNIPVVFVPSGEAFRPSKGRSSMGLSSLATGSQVRACAVPTNDPGRRSQRQEFSALLGFLCDEDPGSGRARTSGRELRQSFRAPGARDSPPAIRAFRSSRQMHCEPNRWVQCGWHKHWLCDDTGYGWLRADGPEEALAIESAAARGYGAVG